MKRIYTPFWEDYELIDAGNNAKLERWGNTVTIRPERNAYFQSVLNISEWKKKAHFEFHENTKNSGSWVTLQPNTPEKWTINYEGCVFLLQLTKYKHVGLFPEQRINWDFIAKNLKEEDNFLNLFAYTGAASLMAKTQKANVFHCDSVKQVITWAKNNMEQSGLADIHWVLEDALKFAEREVRRQKKYKGIIMDPPAFGLGVKKEKWKIENKFPELMRLASKLLEKDGFLIVNTYSPKLDENKIMSTIEDIFPTKKKEINKLCLKATSGKIIEYGELTKISN